MRLIQSSAAVPIQLKRLDQVFLPLQDREERVLSQQLLIRLPELLWVDPARTYLWWEAFICVGSTSLASNLYGLPAYTHLYSSAPMTYRILHSTSKSKIFYLTGVPRDWIAYQSIDLGESYNLCIDIGHPTLLVPKIFPLHCCSLYQVLFE